MSFVLWLAIIAGVVLTVSGLMCAVVYLVGELNDYKAALRSRDRALTGGPR